MEIQGQSKSGKVNRAKLNVFLGAINRVSPRISTPPEILQVGTPFRDVINRNKSKRSKFRNQINIFTHFVGILIDLSVSIKNYQIQVMLKWVD